MISGSGSVATIFISNAGAWVLTDATLSDTAGLLFLGHSVASSLTITAASTLSSTATFDSIGHDSGATNLLAVSGAGALFSTTGSLAVGDAGGGGLTLSNGGSASLGSALLGAQSGAVGTIAVSAATLTAAKGISVGVQGAGTLTVGAGGTVIDAGSLDFVGAMTGGSGSVSVGGAGAVWTSDNMLTVGAAGTGSFTVDAGALVTIGTQLVVGSQVGGGGLLTILSGGTVSVALGATSAAESNNPAAAVGTGNTTADTNGNLLPGGSGTVVVTGAGAMLNLNGDALEVGRAGSGAVTIAQGGTLLTGISDTNLRPGVRVGRAGTGSILITDPGSNMTDAGNFMLGLGGLGLLHVANQATLLVTTDQLGVGNFGVGAGSSGNATYVGGSGRATIDSFGLVKSTTGITVGFNGVNGTLSIAGGGVAEAGTRVSLGSEVVIANAAYSGQGTIEVGAGGTLETDGAHISGAAALRVGNGGTTGAGTSAALLTVSGAGALVNTHGDYIQIGPGGLGELDVTQGGTVLSGTSYSTDPGTSIASTGTGEGILLISDPGSTYTTAGYLIDGNLGQGVVTVQNGGTLNTGGNTLFPRGGLTVAFGPGSHSTLTVTGGNSVLSNVGQFSIGGGRSSATDAGGVGTLIVSGGGTVLTALPPGGYVPPAREAMAAASIAGDPGTDGSSVSVSGSGSNWQISGLLDVGELASGTLDVSGGGLVSASALVAGNSVEGAAIIDIEGASQLDVGASGTGDLDLGVAGAATLTVGTGAAVVIAGSLNEGSFGVLNLAGGGLDPTNSTLAGSTTLSNGAVYQDLGTVSLTGSLVVIGGLGYFEANGVTGAGTLLVGSGGDLVLSDAANDGGAPVFVAGSSDPVVQFADATGTLTISNPAGFAALVQNFVSGDVIDLPNVGTITNVVANGATLQLYGAGNALLAAIGFDSPAAASNASAPGAVTQTAPPHPACFAAGTLIRTADGETLVEALREGQRVVSHFGGTVPVRWLGHRDVDCRAHPRPHDVWPVRVTRDAFAPGRPARDLLLSPDHAVFMDGALIPIRYLTNGATIRQEPADQIVYWHVELPAHDVILAEGLPAESYLDTGNRSAFTNGGTVIHAHADFALRVWEAEACATLALDGPALTNARGTLLARAEALGWRLTDDPAARLAAERGPIDAAFEGGVIRARLPASTTTLRLLSRTSVPAETTACNPDARRLGVAVAEISLDGRRLTLADPALSRGWHDPEAEWRWTDGDGAIDAAGASTIEIRLARAGALYLLARGGSRSDAEAPDRAA